MGTWYYHQSGQQCGPVDEDTLRNLISNGHLSPNELVWTEEMNDWSPAHSVPEFGLVAKEQVEDIEQAAFAYVGSPVEATVEFGDTVACTHACRLPPICFKCGRPAAGYLSHNLSWKPSGYSDPISMLPGPLGWLTRRTAQISIPLCEGHLSRYKKIRHIAGSIAVAAGVLMILTPFGLALVRRRHEWILGWIMCLTMSIAVVAAVIAVLGGRAARASFIDTRHVHLRGACETFLRHIS